MDANNPEELPSSNVERAIPETGPYILRSLLEDLPLSADGDRDDIEITCVEFLGMQLKVPILPRPGPSRINGTFVYIQLLIPSRWATLRWNLCLRKTNVHPSLEATASIP
jgi:hypothetical protein